MSEPVEKLTPYRDGKRRRMRVHKLTNIAILPGGEGANPEARVVFFKSAVKQGRRRPSEGFSAFLARMREDDPEMTESRARRMFNQTSKTTEDKEAPMSENENEAANKAADDLRKQTEELKKQVASLNAIAALTGVEKTHFDALDEGDRTAFLKMDRDARTAAIDAAEKDRTDADPIVYKSASGQEFRKSDDPRLVEMAKSMDEQTKENIRLRKAAEDQALAKRVETELANLPGTVEVRKEILRSVETIEDEATRTAALDVLKANNAKLAKSFTTVGRMGVPQLLEDDAGPATDEIERLAKERAAKEGEDYYTAYEKIAEANPELLAKAMAS